MRRVFKMIKQFFNFFWNWRAERKIKGINKHLEKAVEIQEKERMEFLNEFRFFLRKYLRKDASGTYIPIKGKNKAEIYETVMHTHGDRLKELNIKFSRDLKITL